MNKRLMRRYAEEIIGEIENEELLDKIFDIVLDKLEKHELYNYQIKGFMLETYKKGGDE